MSNTYTITRKLNYHTETVDKRVLVDEMMEVIHTRMKSLGFEYVGEDKTTKTNKNRHIKYVFSIGGDGTMMHSMHSYVKNHSIIVGINGGNIGFLTPFNKVDLEEKIFSLINNEKARVEKRSLLKYKHKKDTGFAVNEYAITAKGSNDMLEFSVEIMHRGNLSKAGAYKANAILVSGPCGSTAYNMNAGGAIVDPSVKCMQILMIAPTNLSARPIIIGKNSSIFINVHREAKVFADGIFIKDMNESSEKLEITLEKMESNILLPNDWNFYSVLSKKLMWNNGKDV